MNTLGNCLVVDTSTESCLIAPNGGYGGVGGGYTKHVALANVAQATLHHPTARNAEHCANC